MTQTDQIYDELCRCNSSEGAMINDAVLLFWTDSNEEQIVWSVPITIYGTA